MNLYMENVIFAQIIYIFGDTWFVFRTSSLHGLRWNMRDNMIMSNHVHKTFLKHETTSSWDSENEPVSCHFVCRFEVTCLISNFISFINVTWLPSTVNVKYLYFIDKLYFWLSGFAKKSCLINLFVEIKCERETSSGKILEYL